MFCSAMVSASARSRFSASSPSRISESGRFAGHPYASVTAASSWAWMFSNHVGRSFYRFVTVRFSSSATLIPGGFSQAAARSTRLQFATEVYEWPTLSLPTVTRIALIDSVLQQFAQLTQTSHLVIRITFYPAVGVQRPSLATVLNVVYC